VKMGLEELTFDVEGIKVYLKPELHIYRNHAKDEPFIGSVPVRVIFPVAGQPEEKYGLNYEEEGFLRYDAGKKIFITALSDFVPTDSKNVELLEKYLKGMAEVAMIYSALLETKFYTDRTRTVITERNFYKNSQGEWKDIGDWWIGVESHEELLEMADAVK